MPTITNRGTINILAEAFVRLNGCKSGALADIGYAKSYARSVKGMKIYEREDVKTAIHALRAKLRAEKGFTVDDCHTLYMDAYKQAQALKQPSAAVSAATGIARLYGLDKDNSLSDRVQIVIMPPISPKRAESEVIENEM